MQIGIINTEIGNITSVANALERMAQPYFISNIPTDLDKADKIIFPGVGHAKEAMHNLRTNNLINFLRTWDKPLLGICLGMQLLFEYSEEGDTECLGIIKGYIKKFKFIDPRIIIPHTGWNSVQWSKNHTTTVDQQTLIKHKNTFNRTTGIGRYKNLQEKALHKANEALEKYNFRPKNHFDYKTEFLRLNNEIPQDIDFYFTHSYFCEPQVREDILGTTEYAEQIFCSAINYQNFYGVQFHPEKSGLVGQKLLENFIKNA